jgi:Winged helix DNA-binding domain
VRTISVAQRRARLGLRHDLASRTSTVEAAASDMVALHSSDPVTVHLSAAARVAGFVPSNLEAALYERKTLVRMLGMRRTLFVVPLDVAAIMDEACTKALVETQRRRLIGLIEAQGIAKDAARWLARAEAATLEAVRARGEAAAVELTKDVPQLRKKLLFGEGTTWGGEVGLSTRVLFLLATEGRIVRTRPRGTWVSGQYRWAELETWLGARLPAVSRREASADLLRRWLWTFGPGTLTDIRWWTGWTAAQTKTALADVNAEGVDVGGATGYVLPGDADPAERPDPWVRLLPGLDPTTMGWKERDWYLGALADQLFDRNGNAGPTVWANGRVIGGWTQTADGRVLVRLLGAADRTTRTLVERERRDLEGWFAGTRVVPRFRTPLEKTLAG